MATRAATVMRRVSRALVYKAPREADRCPACGSTHLADLDLLELRHPIDRRRHGFISLCDDCGLVFANPLPTAEEQVRFYSPAGDWGARRTEAHGHADEKTGESSGSWSRMFEPILDRLPVTTPAPGARVLDFGCGEGKLLNYLQDAGWETYGIEPSFDRAFTRHRKLERIPTEPTFDLIVASHVLEHVTAPLDILCALAAAAAPGGYLVVGVPRLDTLPAHGDYKYVINSHVHLMAYTWPCLQGLLARAGWAAVAPPPDSVSRGRRGQTVARMRVAARRSTEPVALPRSPADVALRVIRIHLSTDHARPTLLRLRLFRLTARLRETRRALRRGVGALRGRLRLRSRARIVVNRLFGS